MHKPVRLPGRQAKGFDVPHHRMSQELTTDQKPRRRAVVERVALVRRRTAVPSAQEQGRFYGVSSLIQPNIDILLPVSEHRRTGSRCLGQSNWVSMRLIDPMAHHIEHHGNICVHGGASGRDQQVRIPVGLRHG